MIMAFDIKWFCGMEKKYHNKCAQTEDGHSVKTFAHNCLFLQSWPFVIEISKTHNMDKYISININIMINVFHNTNSGHLVSLGFKISIVKINVVNKINNIVFEYEVSTYHMSSFKPILFTGKPTSHDWRDFIYVSNVKQLCSF